VEAKEARRTAKSKQVQRNLDARRKANPEEYRQSLVKKLLLDELRAVLNKLGVDCAGMAVKQLKATLLSRSDFDVDEVAKMISGKYHSVSFA
jgi:hypothetical protein